MLLSGGDTDMDIDDLMNNTKYSGGFTSDSRTVCVFHPCLCVSGGLAWLNVTCMHIYISRFLGARRVKSHFLGARRVISHSGLLFDFTSFCTGEICNLSTTHH